MARKISIKPLSVNEVWRGRRFKTPSYEKYERDVLIQLKAMSIPDGSLDVTLKAGLSNKGADIDNIAKPFIDILQKAYGFNDSQIYKLTLIKDHVKKGQEYVEYSINKLYI